MRSDKKGAMESASVVYVDLSANAEQLAQDSAIAVSDGVRWVCLARSKVKRHLAHQLAERYGRRHLQYRLLAVLVYLAVGDHLSEIRQIVIDRDYTGETAENVIKSILFSLVRQHIPDVNPGFVRFDNIKGSRADRLARAVFLGDVKPNTVLTVAEVDRLLGK